MMTKRDELRLELKKITSSVQQLAAHVSTVDDKLQRLQIRFEENFPPVRKRLSGRSQDLGRKLRQAYSNVGANETMRVAQSIVAPFLAGADQETSSAKQASPRPPKLSAAPG